jgi:hypothetical protein
MNTEEATEVPERVFKSDRKVMIELSKSDLKRILRGEVPTFNLKHPTKEVALRRVRKKGPTHAGDQEVLKRFDKFRANTTPSGEV